MLARADSSDYWTSLVVLSVVSSGHDQSRPSRQCANVVCAARHDHTEICIDFLGEVSRGETQTNESNLQGGSLSGNITDSRLANLSGPSGLSDSELQRCKYAFWRKLCGAAIPPTDI